MFPAVLCPLADKFDNGRSSGTRLPLAPYPFLSVLDNQVRRVALYGSCSYSTYNLCSPSLGALPGAGVRRMVEA